MAELIQPKEEVVIVDDYATVEPGFNEQYEELQKNLVFTPSNTVLWFECSYCNRKSATKERLSRHLEQKHSNKLEVKTIGKNIDSSKLKKQRDEPFKCLSCPFACLTNADLMRHSKKHKGVKPFSCKICRKTFSQKGNLKPHMRRHTGETPYQCHICLKAFNHRSSLKKHIDDHTNPKTIPCRFCKKSLFSTQEDRNAHEKAKHSHEDVDCLVCGCILNSAIGLKMHISQMHPDFPGAISLTAEKKWACNYCEKKFSTKAYLIIHHKIHRGEKPFKCSKCDYTAVSRDSVKKHGERAHGQMRPLSCDLCGKTFIYYSHKKAHMLRHYNLKPFSCTKCSRTFLLKRHLVDHLRIHEGIPKFKCEKCDVAYILPDSLRKHKDLHLTNPMKCHLCLKDFWIIGRYNKHMMKHKRDITRTTSARKNPLKCKLCCKTFRLQRALDKHISVGCPDSRELFECSECDALFESITALKKHMKALHSLKEYSCFVCTEPFKRVHQLMRHMEETHPEEANTANFYSKIGRGKQNRRENTEAIFVNTQSSNEVGDNITVVALNEQDLSEKNVLVIDEKLMEPGNIKFEASEITYECYTCALVCYSYDELIDHQLCHENEPTFNTVVKRETTSHVSQPCISISGGLLNSLSDARSTVETKEEVMECEINIGDPSLDAQDSITFDSHDDSVNDDAVTCYECTICASRFVSYGECEKHYTLLHKNKKSDQL